MMFFRRSRRTAPTWGEEERVRMRSALAKLDPWMFWAVPLEAGEGVDYAVVGATGAFAIAICGLEGYAESIGADLRIGEVRLSGFRELKQVSKTLRGRLRRASVYTDVEPIVCLTRAIAGTSRTVRGVRVVRLEDLPGEIGAHARTLEPDVAKRGAQALGRVLRSASGALPDVEDV